MAKGSKTTITDMQTRVLNGFDRELRMGGHYTSGLLRGETVRNWKTDPADRSASSASSTDRRIAALKAEIAEMDRKAAYRSLGK